MVGRVVSENAGNAVVSVPPALTSRPGGPQPAGAGRPIGEMPEVEVCVLDPANHLEMLAHLDQILGDESGYSDPPDAGSLRERRLAEMLLVAHPVFAVFGRMSALNLAYKDDERFYVSRTTLPGPYQFEVWIDARGVVSGTRVSFTKSLTGPEGMEHVLMQAIPPQEFEEHFVRPWREGGKPDVAYFVARLEEEFSGFELPPQ